MEATLGMIDATHIRTYAATVQIDPGIVEKDYVLTKALSAIAQSEVFQNYFLFKGGTALKKCFYPNWRFSEDFDFTVTKALSRAEIKDIFNTTAETAGRLFGLGMRVIEYSQYPKAGSPILTAQLKLGYDGPLRKSSGQKNNIRVDISFDEVVVDQPETKQLIHIYPDDIDTTIRLYSLEEILAEKLRSILQRGKSRDYYDVYLLLKEHANDFSHSQAYDILLKKCEHKKMPKPTLEDFFVPERTEEAAKFWERGLAHQVTNLPPVNSVIDSLRNLITLVVHKEIH